MWKTYRTLKNGMLLDFFIKRIFFIFSKQIFYIFTIFFGDKFILEQTFYNFLNFLQLPFTKLKFNNRFSFLKIFKVTLLVTSYSLVLFLIITL